MNKNYYIEQATWEGVLSYFKLSFKVRRTGSIVLLCPWHSDKTASFFIWPDSKRALCFGCLWKGSLHDFAYRMSPNRSPEETLWISYGGSSYVPEEQLAFTF